MGSERCDCDVTITANLLWAVLSIIKKNSHPQGVFDAFHQPSDDILGSPLTVRQYSNPPILMNEV